MGWASWANTHTYSNTFYDFACLPPFFFESEPSFYPYSVKRSVNRINRRVKDIYAIGMDDL